MNPWNRLSLQVSSIILTCVSIVFTVLLWSQIPDEGWMKIVAGLAGFALELCKFSLLPLSMLLLKNKKTLGLGTLLFVVGGALFTVSIGASVAFLENGEQVRKQQSTVWQNRQTTLSQLDQRIAIGQASAAKDGESSYPNIRERGLNTLEQVEQWQDQRQALLSEPVTEVFSTTGLEESQKFYAWLLLAILIDGCALAGWIVLTQEQKQEESMTPDNESKKENNGLTVDDLKERLEAFLKTQEEKRIIDKVFLETPKTKDSNLNSESQLVESIKETVITTEKEKEETVSKMTKTKLMVIEREMLDRITNGDHGDLITYRGLMKAEKIGYQKAKQILDSLEGDGIFVDTGKGFQLSKVNDNQQNLSYV